MRHRYTSLNSLTNRFPVAKRFFVLIYTMSRVSKSLGYRLTDLVLQCILFKGRFSIYSREVATSVSIIRSRGRAQCDFVSSSQSIVEGPQYVFIQGLARRSYHCSAGYVFDAMCVAFAAKYLTSFAIDSASS